MPGRRLLSEDDYIDPRYGPGHPDMVRRRAVLRETLHRFSTADPPNRYHLLGQTNLECWFDSHEVSPESHRVHVVNGDWGDVTHSVTKAHGICFAALNPELFTRSVIDVLDESRFDTSIAVAAVSP